MGRLSFSFGLILGVLAMALLASPGEPLSCTSQKFTNKMVYPNCADLPHLSAYLHWTYNASNSSLSVAFVAPPATPEGWVAWAINPKATGMAGAQALLALKSNGTMTVKTYDIRSTNFSQSGFKLSYKVWDVSAEESNGTIAIFGKWKLPEKTEMVNQVWQVGSGVSPQGWPMMHAMQPENLQATGTLHLAREEAASPAPQPAGSAPTLGVGFSMGLLVILGSLIVF